MISIFIRLILVHFRNGKGPQQNREETQGTPRYPKVPPRYHKVPERTQNYDKRDIYKSQGADKSQNYTKGWFVPHGSGTRADYSA